MVILKEPHQVHKTAEDQSLHKIAKSRKEAGKIVQSQVESYKRFKKMLLDAALLNTLHYKVWIKGKVEHPGNGVASSPTPQCCSY